MVGLILSAASCSMEDDEMVSAADKTFIQEAFQMNLMDIQKSQIVRTRGSNNQIKNFAQVLIQQGSLTSDDLITLAKERDIQVAVELSPVLTQEVNALIAATPEDFDKKYLQNMVDSRTKLISIYEQEIRKGKDNALREWASGKISGLNKDLANAQKMLDAN